jgi:superfamily I DNA/RNA helicase
MVELNAGQQAVITDYRGARSVVAGPGSGKSTTMVELIRSLLSVGVSASEVRAVTFSKEMASALEKKLNIKGIVSTFHSLGYLICSETERKPVEPELRHRLMCKLVRKWGADYKELDGFIASMRRANISPADAIDNCEIPSGLSRAYAEYEQVRAQEGWMDFDSMLRDSVNLLENNLQARGRWQPKYLIVDEAQDTDDLQWRMMQLMSERHGNITVVGDPNQAFYGFRGAKPDNITNFQQWFPNGKKFYLGRNYRSTQTIVNFVRENAPDDTPAELLSQMQAARNVKGVPIGLKMYWSDDAEAESALKLSQKDPLNSIILARTNRMVGLLERLCARYNIRYHLMGKSGFWKQNEVRKAVEALKQYPLISTEAGLNLTLPGIESKYAVADRTEHDNDALENLKTLRRYGKDFRMAKEFVVYANKMMHRKNDPRGVSISTVHQAKGGEWRNVYLIGANAKGFPHPKGDPKEEKRIYFVAISRAIDMLRISFAGTPSLYLRRYLIEEILDKLREKATEVDKLQEQHKLFA